MRFAFQSWKSERKHILQIEMRPIPAELRSSLFRNAAHIAG